MSTDEQGGGHNPNDPNDPNSVPIKTEQALTEALKVLTQEVRISGIRAAAASGNRDAEMQLQNILHAGRGGGFDAYAGINPDQARVDNTGGGGGFGGGGSGGGGGGGGGANVTTTTLAQARAHAMRNLGQRIATTPAPFGGPGQHRGPGAVRQALGNSIAQSGGTMGGLSQALRQNVPGLGIAMDVVNKGIDVAEGVRDQVVAGREFEQIEGPMGEVAQQRERLGREMWTRVNAFGEGSQNAQEQFMAATKLGYTGDQRQQLLQQMYHLTTSTGMSGSEEASLLEDVSKNANASLGMLTDNIEALSKTAKSAGVNAEVARKKFEDSFQQMTDLGFGNAAGNIAGGFTASIASMGKSMQGTSINLSESDIYRFAGQSGMTPGQFMSRNMQDGGQTLANAYDSNALQMIQGILGANYDAARQLVQQAGPDAVKNNPTLAQQIADQIVANGWIPNPMMLPTYFQNNLQLYNANWQQCLLNMVMFLAGNTPGSAVRGQIQSNTGSGVHAGLSLDASKHQTASSVGFLGGNGWDFKKAKDSLGTSATAGGAQTAFGSLVSKAGGLNQHGHWYNPHDWFSDHTNNTAQGIVTNEVKTGQRNKYVEGLLQQVNDLDDQLMLVQTNSGPKVVTARVAMLHYQNEIATGQATFYAKGKVDGNSVKVTGKSEYAGQGVQQVLGYSDTSEQAKTAASAEGKRTDPTHGISQSKADSELADKTKGSQSVTLDLTPAAAAVLQPLMNGSASQVSTSAAYGLPPSNNYSNAASSPTRTVG